MIVKMKLISNRITLWKKNKEEMKFMKLIIIWMTKTYMINQLLIILMKILVFSMCLNENKIKNTRPKSDRER